MKVEFNKDYLLTWDGATQYAEMQRIVNDENASDLDKMMAFTAFCNSAISNLDEIKEELGGKNASFDDVAKFIIGAVSESSELKN